MTEKEMTYDSDPMHHARHMSYEHKYIRLRTVLDGLEASALRYCLEEKNKGVREDRLAKIIALVKPVADEIQAMYIAPGGEDGCGEGYYNCGGICVPYQCVDLL